MTIRIWQRLSRGIYFSTALILLAAIYCSSLCFAQDKQISNTQSPAPRIFRLHANMLDLLESPSTDTVYRYSTTKGLEAYEQGKFDEADKFFLAAVQDAQRLRISDARLSILLTNLGATYREERKFPQSEALFKQALTIEKVNLTANRPFYDYTVKQYAGLLRKTDRETDAKFLEEAARPGFIPIKPDNTKKAEINMNNIDASVGQKATKVGSGQGPVTARYTITLIPSYKLDHANKPDTVPFEHPTEVSGSVILVVESKDKPLRVECKIPPDTRICPTQVHLEETLEIPGWKRQPDVQQHTLLFPCDIEATTYTETFTFHHVDDTSAVDPIYFEFSPEIPGISNSPSVRNQNYFHYHFN